MICTIPPLGLLQNYFDEGMFL